MKYMVELDPDEADKITVQVLKETLEFVELGVSQKDKGAKKDAKALKRVIKMFKVLEL